MRAHAAAIAAVLAVSAPAGIHAQPGTTARAAVTCAPDPSACGFPDATNTGPGSTTLTAVPGTETSGPGWSYTGGAIYVTGAGASVDDITTAAQIVVEAPNVTINDDKIVGVFTDEPAIALEPAANGVLIENSYISGTNTTTGRMLVGIKDVEGTPVTGIVIDKCDIQEASTGIQIYTGTIENSYIHNLGMQSGDHVNGITNNGGASELIQHNTVLNQYSQTDAISLFEDFGPIGNITINDNLLAGGGYAVYGGGSGGDAPISSSPYNVDITNNVFSTLYFANSGFYGPDAYVEDGNGNVWSGNVWDGTGVTVPE
jgi:hypothetical protein